MKAAGQLRYVGITTRSRRCVLAVIPTLSLLVGAATLWVMVGG